MGDAVREKIDSPDSEPSEQSSNAGVVCTACLTSNPPHTNYCSHCGALLNSLAAFNPFDQTLVEGFAYRRAVDGPPSKIILIGMWLVFGPEILFISCVFFSEARLGNSPTGTTGSTAENAYLTAFLIISVLILYRTTVNYFSKRKSVDPSDL